MLLCLELCLDLVVLRGLQTVVAAALTAPVAAADSHGDAGSQAGVLTGVESHESGLRPDPGPTHVRQTPCVQRRAPKPGREPARARKNVSLRDACIVLVAAKSGKTEKKIQAAPQPLALRA